MLQATISSYTPQQVAQTQHKFKNKRELTLPKEQFKKDIFFKGKENHNTHTALKLIEGGESAGNVLVILLKNADFQSAVQDSILHTLEGVIPFVNLATKAPGIFNSLDNLRTKDYRNNLKNKFESYVKNPNATTLKAWQKAEDNYPDSWREGIIKQLTPADEMYKASTREWINASNVLKNRVAPNNYDQSDLERGILRKTTAIGTLMLFNSNNIIASNRNFACQPSYRGFGRDITAQISTNGFHYVRPTSEYGKDLLLGQGNFDLLTALKIADLYQSKFDKYQRIDFYKNLYEVVKDDFTYDTQVGKLLLFREMLKKQSFSPRELGSIGEDAYILCTASEDDVKKEWRFLLGFTDSPATSNSTEQKRLKEIRWRY